MILARPVSYTILVFLLVFSSAIALSFLTSADYIKKEKVTGIITPELGLVAVFPPQAGILTKLNVVEGQHVEKNDELFGITVDHRTMGGEYIGLKLIEELDVQEKYLSDQLKLEHDKISNQIASRKAKAEQLKKEIDQLKNLISTHNKTLEIELGAYKRAQIMFAEGFISSADVENYYRRYLDQKQKIQTFTIKMEETIGLFKEIPFNIKELKVNSKREISRIESQFSEISKQRIQIKGNRQLSVKAPVSGQISSVVANLGQKVNLATSLFSIIPENSRLQANIYLPTRSIGFLETGQLINIRYEAFPYEKFGTYPGEIYQISKSVIFPGEIPSGLTFQEPVYKAIATLKSQSIMAYGKEINLKPGMVLSADVVLNKRSLFEWLFEPLYSLNGKI